MEIDTSATVPHPSPSQPPLQTVHLPHGASHAFSYAHNDIRTPGSSSSRALRTRLCNTAPISRTSKTPKSSPSTRGPSEKEMDNIRRRLGPEGVASRRAELLKAKDEELRGVIDDHDEAVREKFHLERFVSLLENYDPQVSA